MSVFCAWRIQDPAQFLAKFKTVDSAESRIKNQLRNATKIEIGHKDMGELVNVDPNQMKLDEIEKKLASAVQDNVRPDGVEIVLVGLTNLGLSEPVSEKVIDTMKEERQTKVKEYEQRGISQATAIRERAQAAAGRILSFAHRKGEEIKAEGDAAAAAYLEKFKGYEEFALFLRHLRSFRDQMKSKTVFLLDQSNMPILEWLSNPPTVQSIKKLSATQPAMPAPPAETER